ncbi:hypothetical protein LAZ67_18000360 [Cordylochernes scorpioides]|uniref:Glycosyltransferase family 92 protein n=1 Tax=Cordylochernes scorpioides TaxID=51811 RepID=A0ABY6LEU7_9ARAC|nr:hypothetical protein LAZ67_18000360 [Cordylochernes scorpioides]
MAAAKKNSERRARSAILVIFFLGLFLALLTLEMLFVDESRGEEGLLSRLARADLEAVLVRDPGLPDNHTDHWQAVRGARDRFFVFSAFLDDRRGRYVRIIAAARTRLADKVMCQFWYPSGGHSPVAVFATNRLIRENWNLRYSAYFLLCPFPSDIWQAPEYVSVIKPGDRSTSNKILIHKPRKSFFSGPKGIAVCVKPLHYNYNKVVNMAEFIELNRILGVNHFFFYNHTIGPQVSCILRWYMDQGLVTLLPWHLNIASQREIRTEGLFAALNDCLYRTMYRYQFVLMIDLDEYIIPHRNDSLPIMLDQLLRKNPSRTGAFSFQNSFFYLQWPDDSASLPYPLVTLAKTRRKAKFHAHKQRSKCIVLPERVVEMGNHFVWEFAAGKAMANVAPDLGFLHHYRVCEFGGDDCINTSSVTDRRVHHWKSDLLAAVSKTLDPSITGCLR